MEVMAVTLSVCVILGISYLFFSQTEKKKKCAEKKRNMLIGEFFRKEMANIESLQLSGIGTDKNSDFEFIQAVRKINMPDDIKVKIYD